jgi:LysM repeat protein
LELAFAGVLLVVVLYIGGIFNKGESPIPKAEATPLPTQPPPPATESIAAPTSAPTPVPTATLPPTPVSQAVATTLTYQITPGDTCLGIALQFNISLESLIAANGLDAECRIIAGGILNVPAPTAMP